MLRSLGYLARLLGIAWILARHGALFPLIRLPQLPAVAMVAGLAHFFRRRATDKLRPGERLARTMEALGPSFIKFGQSLATRTDLIGEEMAHDLARLQDRLPPFSTAIARATVERELGEPIDSLFAVFDDRPIAAASIAQVHFAETTEGEQVAVKILRPEIEKAFERDLDLFHWVAELLEHYLPWFRRLKPVEVVELFAETVHLEMDLRFEAAAASELAENFHGDPDFKVPAVNWRRTTRRVLTLERLHGIRIDDIPALEAAGHDPTELMRKSACVFFNQVFRDGFFHADMHPGNIFVEADGSLAPVDFGIMGRLDVATRHFLADMLLGFLTGDYHKAAEVHFRAGYVPSHKSLDAFTQACRSIGEPIMGRPLHEISLARLLAQLFAITEQFEMETQPQLLLLQKTMLVAEGVGRQLNPNVNLWTMALPLIEEWMRQNRGPEARVKQAAREAVRLAERLPVLAERLEGALDDLSQGGLRLHPETVRRFATERRRARPAWWPLWLGLVIALVALLA